MEECMVEAIKTLKKSFSGYSIGVLISRVSGMCRDIALAFFFGTTAEIALFIVAYRFANLMRRILAESPLSSSFVPVFEGARARSIEEGALLFRDLFYSLSVLVTGIVLLAIGGLALYAHYYPLGDTLAYLTEVMLPSLLFISLYGLCSTFLQCEKSFFLPAVAPVAFNCVWIVVAFFAHRFPLEDAMKFLAYGVVLAFVLQWVVVMPKVFKLIARAISARMWKPRLFHTSLKPMVKPFFMGTLGIGATQINIALDSVFARCASLEGPAFLWYAIRIEQVPIALFGVAIAAAILPPLTRSIQRKDLSTMRALLQQGYKQTFALMTFSMFGLFALGYLVVLVLFGRGEFQIQAVEATTRCLWCYALGLIPHGWTMLLASTHYAYLDFQTPMRGALYSVLLNIAVNALMVFVFHWGPASIAVGTSLTSLFNACYLNHRLKAHLQDTFVTFVFYLRTWGCGTLSFLLTAFLVHILLIQGYKPLVNLLGFGVLSVLYLVIYCVLEKLFQCEEVGQLINIRGLLK
jgi:putative peptidoglycan lipid II flippase